MLARVEQAPNLPSCEVVVGGNCGMLAGGDRPSTKLAVVSHMINLHQASVWSGLTPGEEGGTSGQQQLGQLVSDQREKA